MAYKITNPRRKAQSLNFNPRIYGTVAEIGAGQEVARRFFRAGGASGTVAKTISAYDMEISDIVYGPREDRRYVCEERLRRMLNVEYDSLVNQLTNKKDENTRYFAFADTIETINFQRTNEGHGWIGVKYQLNPKSEPNTVVLHIRMLENDTLLQQRTVGILGVNLIYACYHYSLKPKIFLKSLLDYLSAEQIEVDMIKMEGPDLAYIDNRLLSVQLVKNGMTSATVFDKHMNVCRPSDIFYNKNILVLRGSFRPITYVENDILQSSFEIFKRDVAYKEDNTFTFCEISLENLLRKGDFDEQDFLDRADILCGMGINVMISNFKEHYKLVSHFAQFKIKKLRIIIGVLTFKDVFDEKYYDNLKGGIFEAMGKLFVNNMKLYVYPAKQEGSDKLLNSKNVSLHDDILPLLEYLNKKRKIINIENVDESKLHIFSKDVITMIQQKDSKWEELVPKFVAERIKTNKMFGYKN